MYNLIKDKELVGIVGGSTPKSPGTIYATNGNNKNTFNLFLFIEAAFLAIFLAERKHITYKKAFAIELEKLHT